MSAIRLRSNYSKFPEATFKNPLLALFYDVFKTSFVMLSKFKIRSLMKNVKFRQESTKIHFNDEPYSGSVNSVRELHIKYIFVT